MRIDVVTIFPDYLAPLELSLAGKARDGACSTSTSTTCAQWTHDRHRTVDDTPYGGGAGMVMKPEPWGEALDALLPDGATLVVPTPSGAPFTQALARELAGREHLVFACGRYEGIDQRVIDHAAGRAEVREISLGDYVLNGGEVAALAITEAVVRLLPGFMGNAASLLEESHEDGLLEYPVYTKPATWRGRDVPPVLLSGDHAAIAAWRHDAVGTAHRGAPPRPGCTARRCSTTWRSGGSSRADAGELLTLQRACWVPEQLDNPGVLIPALHESLDDLRAWIAQDVSLVARSAGRLVGAVRARLRRRRVGHRPADGRPRLSRPRARSDAARHDRGRRAARGDVVRAVHRRRQRPQPADVQEGRLPPARGDRAGRRRMTKQRLPAISGGWSRCGRLAPRSSRPNRGRPRTPSGGGPRQVPATGGA